MSVRRPLSLLLALVLGLACSVAMAACGDRSNLIPADDASALKDRLAEARQAIEAGDCDAAARAVRRVRNAAQEIPAEVDRRLRSRINDGVQALEREAPQDCADAAATQTTETTESVPAETTETTESVPTTTTPPETTPTVTTPPAETTPPTETTPPAETTPEGTGGIEPDEGEVPAP